MTKEVQNMQWYVLRVIGGKEKKTVDFIEKEIDRVGLKDFISSTLRIELNNINPFEKITQNQAVEDPEIFAIVAGMALRGNSEA